ncbi:MAG: hypothetical protein RH942_01790 [Kiloniellaceae bacterium]
MADNDLVNDELERVYRLYGERTRHFRRSLYVLIIVGLAVFLLIVVPFLTFRDQLAAQQQREARLATELQQARDLVTDTESGLAWARELRAAIARFYQEQTAWQLYREMEREAAEHRGELEELKSYYARWDDARLAAWLSGEARQPPEEVVRSDRRLYSLSFKTCYWDSGIERVSCRLCDGFSRQHERFAGAISRLPAVSEEIAAAASADLGAIASRACGWLTGGEVHWRREQVFPGDSVDRLRGWFSYDLNAYVERFEVFEGNLREALPQRALQVERLQRSRTAVAERLTILEAQLGRIASFDRVGTPVGDLPVGLGQIVLLFPAVLAFGFLVVANSYAASAGLQRAFVRLCRKRDAAGEVMDTEHIAAIAPLWLDPRDPLGARLAKWAILLTPLALTLANLLLIATTAALSDQLPDDAVIPPVAYLLLYAAALALFAGTLWHIRRSGRALPGTAATAPET